MIVSVDKLMQDKSQGTYASFFSTAVYSNAHRGRYAKPDSAFPLFSIIEEKTIYKPSKGWADMIRIFDEVDPL